ncbi:hypothetical protein K2173_005200 [Erythroxylum novogranatense]|uniref:Cytochrome P450 n=1 Tax=Erythroxylum novogranatense TaxID=1862640 RepID=A0AAV8TRJ1_9ROSI|nr:hypothetical protein K2173_005200 [Erythroxylum novogranatense]
MAWFLSAILALIAVFVFLKAALSIDKNTHTKLPPGPRGLPIIGSFHLLGKNPHRSLHELAQKYGPIMHMRLGLAPTIIISSPEAAELVLKTHDIVFASRPPLEASKYSSYNQKNVTLGPYGSYWRNMRKLCTLELLSSLKVNSLKSSRKQVLDLMVQSIKEASCRSQASCRRRLAVNLRTKLYSLSADMSCLMVFGKKYSDNEFDERGFNAIVHEEAKLTAIPNLGDYIPQIAWLDLQGLRKRMKAAARVFDEFFEKIIEEHIKNTDENRTKDFIDVMLGLMGSEETEYRVERDSIKAVILDMLAASMDTSPTVVEWALSEIIKNQHVMKKVQKESEEKVGMDRMVEESDLKNLHYLNMIIKETFRLHPVAPLLLPHYSMEDCIVNGFFIPKNSRIMINVWTIGRDPSVWSEPDKFLPERFAGTDIDVLGHDFQLIPFGAGRRVCPGMQLGLTIVSLVLAQLLHCFDWGLPDGMVPAELDMTEEFGLVTQRTKPLLAIPTYRLHI